MHRDSVYIGPVVVFHAGCSYKGPTSTFRESPTVPACNVKPNYLRAAHGHVGLGRVSHPPTALEFGVSHRFMV